MGAAEACWQRSRDYVLNREQFGRPQDEGVDAPEMMSLIKRKNAGKALDIARSARVG